MTTDTNSNLPAYAPTVYTKAGCVQCTATFRELGKLHMPYRVVDVARDAEAKTYVASLGYAGVPVVVLPDGTHWHGYRPERLQAHAATVAKHAAAQ